MVSLETETDRTLFFDLLPIDVGVIGGFKTRLQLYTIPGQVFYNTTRKLVLKGVDGLVFVADSQVAMQDANADSIRNLRENLAEIGLELDDIPLVIQLNKRDLPGVATVDEMLDVLDPERKHEHIEAIAATGVGVFETLKLISKLTLRTLRRRMTGDEPHRTTAGGPRTGGFRVKETAAGEPRPTMSGTPVPAIGTQLPPNAPTFSSSTANASIGTATVPDADEVVEEIGAAEEVAPPQSPQVFSDRTLAKTAAIDSRIIASAPVAEARSTAPHAPVVPPDPGSPEPDIDFNQTEKPSKSADVKHVKVRSSVDIMAELESLRKRATAGAAPAKPKKEVSPLDALMGKKPAPAPKRDIQKSVSLHVPADTLARSKSMRVTVSFEGSDGVVQTQEQTVDLADATDARSLSVNLKVDTGNS